MKEDETIDNFTTKLTTLTHKAANLGHTMEDETLVHKLLNAIPDRYLQIVTSIEQYLDLSEMTFEEVIGRLKTYEERIKYKGKQVDNQNRLLFTRYEKQGRRRGHGGSNQSRGQENNFKKETHTNSNKLTHDKSKEIPFNLDLTDIKQQGVSRESLDGGITESMNQPGIKEDIHCKNSKLEGGNNQKYDQPGLKEDHNNEEDRNLETYFVKENKEDRLHEILDRQVVEETTDEQLKAACDLVYRCLKVASRDRPSMRKVTMELESLKKRDKHPWIHQESYNETSKLMGEREDPILYTVPLGEYGSSSIGTEEIMQAQNPQ
nr:wall-associated receptor kinase 2-like [Tanacetum cinerariifolium]